MSLTITRTQPREESTHKVLIRLHPQARSESYISIAKRLATILQTHQNQTDTLSKDLFKQGHKFLHFVINSQTTPSLESLTVHFIKLKEHLLNPFGTTLLEDPWLLGDLVWEKYVLDRYFKCLKTLSPDPIPIEPTPHTFAKQMVTWIKSLEAPSSPPASMIQAPIQRANELGMIVLVRPAHMEQDPITTLAFLNNEEPLDVNMAWNEYDEFNKNIQMALIMREKLQCTKQHKKENKVMKLALNRRDEQRKLDLQRVDDSCKQQTEGLKNSIITIQTNFQNALDLRKQIEAELRQDIKKAQGELVKAQEEISSQKGTIGNLMGRINSLGQQVGWLQNQVNNSNDGLSCIIS